jgi:hypothetical protein
MISNKAQLTLRMTEEQILTIREEDKRNALHAKGGRFFNDMNKEVWKGTTRKVNPSGKTETHWLYAADQARMVAANKTEKKHRKYWNKIAAGYDMKARTAHSMKKFGKAYKELAE